MRIEFLKRIRDFKSRQWRLEVRCYLSAFFVYARLKFQKPADLKTDF